VHKAVSTGQAALQKNVTVGTNGGRQTIDLVVQPIRPGAAQDLVYMVIFQDIGGIRQTIETETAESAEELENASWTGQRSCNSEPKGCVGESCFLSPATSRARWNRSKPETAERG
jgi:hypothetical protein